ncbi:hypothetical protein GGR54DRAFT_645774 [Hypoxylon sp. NC1633]|nr:hypothetical protein GGR54DRAFT_645774 [Hypoxylon sp. NC1633]
MDGRIPTIAAAAGYPVGTMPLGYSKTNGRAFGVCIVASKDQGHQILRVMKHPPLDLSMDWKNIMLPIPMFGYTNDVPQRDLPAVYNKSHLDQNDAEEV